MNTRCISRLSDFEKYSPQFIIAIEETRSYMGADYGPPDPPPTMENVTTIQLLSALTEADVIDWIKNNESDRYNKQSYRVIKVSLMSISTEVTVNLK